jgi:hypothetical protein
VEEAGGAQKSNRLVQRLWTFSSDERRFPTLGDRCPLSRTLPTAAPIVWPQLFEKSGVGFRLRAGQIDFLHEVFFQGRKRGSRGNGCSLCLSMLASSACACDTKPHQAKHQPVPWLHRQIPLCKMLYHRAQGPVHRDIIVEQVVDRGKRSL